ncbi:hypothetical protein QBC44DRAFT_391448 [Cladorrhinum sp. PSN332]|nr:hypothetical protein QBC44DRAFT_391448 [Cladorrhinum sp. PSN332]
MSDAASSLGTVYIGTSQPSSPDTRGSPEHAAQIGHRPPKRRSPFRAPPSKRTRVVDLPHPTGMPGNSRSRLAGRIGGQPESYNRTPDGINKSNNDITVSISGGKDGQDNEDDEDDEGDEGDEDDEGDEGDEDDEDDEGDEDDEDDEGDEGDEGDSEYDEESMDSSIDIRDRDDDFNIDEVDEQGGGKPPPQFPPASEILGWIGRAEGPRRQLARRIVYALHVGVIPCPGTKHADAERRHRRACEKHLGLRDTYRIDNRLFPPSEAEEEHELVGIHRKQNSFPGRWVLQDRSSFPSQARLQSLFTPPPIGGAEICLHKDSPQEMTPPLQYSSKDIDSAIIIFSDLNSFREKISIPVIPIHNRLLQKSIHLSWRLEFEGKQQNVPLHKIPHMVFATADVRQHAIYIFFPRMYRPKCSTHLTGGAYEALYDRMIQPGLVEGFLSSPNRSLAQHIPRSYQDAVQMGQAAASGGHGSRAVPTNLCMVPSENPGVWERMKQELAGAALLPPSNGFDITQFEGLFFVYNSKGLKVETQQKRHWNLAPCIGDFQRGMSKAIPEMRRVSNDSRQYIDIASEVMSHSNQNLHRGAILLAKRCCVRHTRSFILNGDRQQRIVEYPIALLRDAVTLTAEPTPKHPHVKDGLIYMQTYSPFKELLDARGRYPFSHPGIPNLGYSQADHDSYHRVQKTKPDRADAEKHDIRSRAQIRCITGTLKRGGPANQDYGWRTEFRITVELARVIEEEDKQWVAFLARHNARGTLRRSQQGVTVAPCPDPPPPIDVEKLDLPSHAFFTLGTDRWNEFIQENVNKYLTAMDTIRCLHFTQVGVPTATGELHALITLVLRHFISHLRPRQGWILNEARATSSDGRERKGFGLRQMMDRYGFGFFSPDIVDWQRLQLTSQYINQLTFPGFQRISNFQQSFSYQAAQTFLDSLLELTRHPEKTDLATCEFILEKCTHLMLQEYRSAALLKLFQSNQSYCPRFARFANSQVNGQQFSLQGFSQIAVTHSIGRTFEPMRGNRMLLTTGVKMFMWTWGDADVKFKRNWIQNLPFRQMFRKACDGLDASGNPHATSRRLWEIMAYRFFEQHSALPYPDGNGTLTQVAKQAGNGSRKLFCFVPLMATTVVPRGYGWERLVEPVRAVPHPATDQQHPAPVPAYLDRLSTFDAFEAWIRSGNNIRDYA